MIQSSTFQRLAPPMLRHLRWKDAPLLPLGIALLAHLLLMLPLTVSWRGVAGLALLVLVPGILLADLFFPSETDANERIPLIWALGVGLLVLLTLALHIIPGPLSTPLLLLAIDLITLVLAALQWRQVAQDEGRRAHEENALFSSSAFRLPPSVFRPSSLVFFFLLLLAAVLRLTWLDYSEFQGDEARAALLAAGVVQGQDGILLVHQKAPGEVLIPAASYALLGELNEFNARLPFAIASIVALPFAYALTRRMLRSIPGIEHYGTLAGLLAMAVLVVSGLLVAFGRLLQYQSVVVLCNLAAVWCCWRFYEGVTTPKLYLTLAAVLCAVGMLAHYEGALVVPVLVLIFFAGAYRHKLSWRQQFHLGWLPAALLVGLPACFYVPFVLSPSFWITRVYVLRRISKEGGVGLPPNNVPFVFNIDSFYSSMYQVIAMGTGLVAALVFWLRTYVRPRALAWSVAVVLVVGVVIAYFLPTLLTISTYNLTVALIAPAFLVLLLARRTPLVLRVLLLWFCCTFMVATFLVRKPGTHFYTGELSWALLLAVGCTQWIGPRWSNWRTWSRVALLMFGSALLALAAYYIAIVYVRHTPEYKRVYPDARPAIYRAPYGDSLPDGGFFGFPYRAGWKTLGYLYQQGLLSGTYDTNEEDLITGWYMRGAPRCTWRPEYYFVAEQVQDVRWIPLDTIKQEYQRIGTIDVSEKQKIAIYRRNGGRTLHVVPPADLQAIAAGPLGPTGIPQVLDGTHFEEGFDRLNGPDFPVGIALSPGLAQAVPGHKLDATFTRGARLYGYDLYAERGGQRRYLTLYWGSTMPQPPTYETHLTLTNPSGTPVAPATTPCGDSPPTTWNDPNVNYVSVTYEIADTTAATAHVTIVDGMSSTALPLLNGGTGNEVVIPLDNARR